MLTTAANLCRFHTLPRAVYLSPAGQSVQAKRRVVGYEEAAREISLQPSAVCIEPECFIDNVQSRYREFA